MRLREDVYAFWAALQLEARSGFRGDLLRRRDISSAHSRPSFTVTAKSVPESPAAFGDSQAGNSLRGHVPGPTIGAMVDEPRIQFVPNARNGIIKRAGGEYAAIAFDPGGDAVLFGRHKGENGYRKFECAAWESLLRHSESVTNDHITRLIVCLLMIQPEKLGQTH